MHYYLLQNGQKIGPLLQHQVISKLQDETISLQDLAWRQGDLEWIPLSQMGEIAGHALLKNRREDKSHDLSSDAVFSENELPDIPPFAARRDARLAPFAPPAALGLRLMARFIDLFLIFMSASFVLVSIFGEETMLQYQNWKFEQFIGVHLGLRLFMIAYEIVFLKFFGATLGKLFFRLRVIDEDGNFPTWKTAIQRTVDSFVRGGGIYFIYFTPFTLILSINFTIQNQVAPWDVRTKLQVVRKP